jgi:hypothetical protein
LFCGIKLELQLALAHPCGVPDLCDGGGPHESLLERCHTECIAIDRDPIQAPCVFDNQNRIAAEAQLLSGELPSQ